MNALRTLSVLVLVLTLSTGASWAQKPQQQFPLTANVIASRLLYRPNAEPVTAVPRLRIFVVINGKRYQLDHNTFSTKARLLHLGNYPAALEYHPLGNTGEFTEKCLLKMPDGKTMKFMVTGISELSDYAATPKQ